MSPADSVINSGDTYDSLQNPGTDLGPVATSVDQLGQGAPVNMPDLARYIPNDVQDGIQQEDTASTWAQAAQQKLADIWAQLHLDQGQQMVQNAVQAAQQALSTPHPELLNVPGVAAGAQTQLNTPA